MTSRETTSILALREDTASGRGASVSDVLHRLAFGAIGWPWLLYSLWGGTQESKRRLMARIGLAEGALPNLGSWKADTGFLHRIVDAVEELRPQVVVELGAGASTLVCAKALARNGGGRLISFDQHRDFVEATANWVAEEGAEADVRWAPLVDGATEWPGRWYELHGVPAQIDLLIIDGPPWAVHPFVRGAAESLFDRLSPGGMVLLDDAARPGERIVARRWRRNWPAISFERASGSTKGTLVGRKHDARSAVHPTPEAANENSPFASWRRAAAIFALFGAGWLANEVTGDFSAPAQAASIVDEAHASHAAGRAREGIISLPESERLDRGEIARATGLDLPVLPAGWQVSDVQLYPSDLGNVVTVTLLTEADERLSLLAARAETPAEGLPMLERREGAAIAYWEEGPLAYALVGELEARILLKYASRLSAAPAG
ncbi:class I SAM-dependent methyltransferase [Erythrobacter sp. NFXS35]|uniref:class I SAM-dependent methyltransferase n=1 Tax=Erythrobacter sp. NFXS35 TaxID=2818436 RepID=UPI0032DE628C